VDRIDRALIGLWLASLGVLAVFALVAGERLGMLLAALLHGPLPF